MTDVTRILKAIEQGNERATDKPLPFVYEELRLSATQNAGIPDNRSRYQGIL